MPKVWYVSSNGQQVVPSSRVSAGVASEDIYELVLLDGARFPTSRVWAAKGTAVASERASAADAAAATDPIPATRSSPLSGGEAPERLEGVPVWVYGSSFAVDPGFACTAGLEFHKLAAARLGTTTTTFAASGKSIRDASERVVGGKGIANAAWTPARRGIGVIDTWVNDLAAYAAGPAPRAFEAKDVTGIRANLRAALAVMSAATIIENTAGTKTGTWLADGASNERTGGSNAMTSETGAALEFTGVTFGSDGYVWYLGHTLDPASFQLAPVDVFVDGVKVRSIPASEFYCHRLVEGGTDSTGPAAFRIDAAPGVHTVRLVHAGAAGTNMLVDALLVPRPSAARSPVFVIQDQLPRPVAAGAFYKTQAQIDVLVGNWSQLLAAYQQVLGEFPNAVFVRTTLDAATDYGADGLHPNDRGMQRKADELVDAIRDFTAKRRPDNMYAVV